MHESELMQALSKHISDDLEEERVVVNYIIIADTLDSTGDSVVAMSTSNDKWDNDLKMLEYARERTKYNLHKQWKASDAL